MNKEIERYRDKAHLHGVRDVFPLREYLGQTLGAEDRAQGRGGQQLRGGGVVGHVRNSDGRVADAVIDHGVDGHSHGVLAQHL